MLSQSFGLKPTQTQRGREREAIVTPVRIFFGIGERGCAWQPVVVVVVDLFLSSFIIICIPISSFFFSSYIPNLYISFLLSHFHHNNYVHNLWVENVLDSYNV